MKKTLLLSLLLALSPPVGAEEPRCYPVDYFYITVPQPQFFVGGTVKLFSVPFDDHNFLVPLIPRCWDKTRVTYTLTKPDLTTEQLPVEGFMGILTEFSPLQPGTYRFEVCATGACGALKCSKATYTVRETRNLR